MDHKRLPFALLYSTLISLAYLALLNAIEILQEGNKIF